MATQYIHKYKYTSNKSFMNQYLALPCTIHSKIFYFILFIVILKHWFLTY